MKRKLPEIQLIARKCFKAMPAEVVLDMATREFDMGDPKNVFVDGHLDSDWTP